MGVHELEAGREREDGWNQGRRWSGRVGWAVCAVMMGLATVSCDPASSDLGNPKPYESFRVACVERINAFRATEGLPALARWKDAEACSDGEAKSDSQTGKAHGAFGACKEWAQDECPGWGSVESTVQGCLQSMWDERLHPTGEQGHYRNMTNAKYTMVACGFYETPGGKVWALQNFK